MNSHLSLVTLIIKRWLGHEWLDIDALDAALFMCISCVKEKAIIRKGSVKVLPHWMNKMLQCCLVFDVCFWFPELEAYAGVISALRAQGDLTKDKKDLLGELTKILG